MEMSEMFKGRWTGGMPVLVLLLLLCSSIAFSEERKNKPLWELGLIGIGGYVPDYPASDENRFHAIPLPYVVYRGKIFRAGDKGLVRGRFIRKDRLEFDLSLDGSFDAPTTATERDSKISCRDTVIMVLASYTFLTN